MKIKVITNQSPQVALKNFKVKSLRSIPSLKRVEFAMNTITKEG
jgi:hypothetical protein